jgi:hypothetical protein
MEVNENYLVCHICKPIFSYISEPKCEKKNFPGSRNNFRKVADQFSNYSISKNECLLKYSQMFI